MNFFAFLGPILGIGETFIDAKTKRALAKIELQTATLKAQADAALKAAESENGWEMLAGNDAKMSWKDEFWTIILAIPLVLAFIPGLAGYVKAGFDVLGASVPEWYAWALLAAISFAFARKKMPALFGRK